MPVPYLILADKSIIITLSSGPVTMTPTSLNYTLVREALIQGVDKSVITSLIHEATPNGLFYAYDHHNELLIKHIDKQFRVSMHNPTSQLVPSSLPEYATYLGTFASYEAVLQAFPEYLL